jgi:glutamyl-tRNA synthetase
MTQKITKPRVRFAPSPTGHLHLGGLRTALFNWYFARHYKGTFLLRIEDTDLERSKEEYLQSILKALAWCGITPDEPLVIQSQRIHDHRNVAEKLVAEGKAYYCYCTPAELESRCGITAAESSFGRYDGKCRSLMTVLDKPHVIRFKLPEQEQLVVHDLIRGDISFPLAQYDDFIIIRSDGSPMYNFCVVVDDAWMEITHVIRGEEHLVNTPKQILLYQACGYSIPSFAHTPLILGPDGSKLSKRDAATAVVDYQVQGILPEALCNYLMRLGWAHGDQEIFTPEQITELFKLEDIGSKGAIFDLKKLYWVNSVYLRKLSGEEILHLLKRMGFDLHAELETMPLHSLIRLVDLCKERVQTLVELRELALLIYHQPQTYEPFVANELTVSALEEMKSVFMQHTELTREQAELLIKQVCEKLGMKLGQVGPAMRIALTGKSSAPSLFDLISILGPQKAAERLQSYSIVLQRSGEKI